MERDKKKINYYIELLCISRSFLNESIVLLYQSVRESHGAVRLHPESENAGWMWSRTRPEELNINA